MTIVEPVSGGIIMILLSIVHSYNLCENSIILVVWKSRANPSHIMSGKICWKLLISMKCKELQKIIGNEQDWMHLSVAHLDQFSLYFFSFINTIQSNCVELSLPLALQYYSKNSTICPHMLQAKLSRNKSWEFKTRIHYNWVHFDCEQLQVSIYYRCHCLKRKTTNPCY